MTEPELKEVYNLYTECWKLFREHHGARTNQEWEKLQNRAEEIVKKYGDYSRSLVMDTIILIERRSKNGTLHG